jgi:hypothetical protein
MNKLNTYGVPIHACNGVRQDEHYWAWLSTVTLDTLYERYCVNSM